VDRSKAYSLLYNSYFIMDCWIDLKKYSINSVYIYLTCCYPRDLSFPKQSYNIKTKCFYTELHRSRDNLKLLIFKLLYSLIKALCPPNPRRALFFYKGSRLRLCYFFRYFFKSEPEGEGILRKGEILVFETLKHRICNN